MKRAFAALLIAVTFSGCGTNTALVETSSIPSQTTTMQQNSPYSSKNMSDSYSQSTSYTETPENSESGQEESVLKISVGEYEFEATFENNPSAVQFRKLLEDAPITVEMSDYGGFEKVGDLGITLPRSDEQITTEPGDVILYQGNQITIYYASNTWNFTKLAKINDVTDLTSKLGSGTVQVTFSVDTEA